MIDHLCGLCVCVCVCVCVPEYLEMTVKRILDKSVAGGQVECNDGLLKEPPQRRWAEE